MYNDRSTAHARVETRTTEAAPGTSRLMSRPAFSALTGVVLAASLSAVAVPAATATTAPSTADSKSCKFRDKSLYPGSALGPKWRYGEVELSFEVCGQNHDNWKHEVTKKQVNGTGKSLGFFIDGVSLKPVTDTASKRVYRMSVDAASCVPKVGWPCYRTYGMKASLHVYESGKIKVTNKNVPLGMALHNTQ